MVHHMEVTGPLTALHMEVTVLTEDQLTVRDTLPLMEDLTGVLMEACMGILMAVLTGVTVQAMVMVRMGDMEIPQWVEIVF